MSALSLARIKEESIPVSIFDDPVQGVKVAAHAVKRSASTPIPNSALYESLKDCQIPKRSVSTTLAVDELNTFLPTAECVPPLNGVSLYYSAKTTTIVLDPDRQGLLQLTNAQKISRCYSFNAQVSVTRSISVHALSIVRSFTVRRVRSLMKNAPFPNLLRSHSLETPQFYQSVCNFRNTKDAINQVARARHRFRGGKMSASSRNFLMRAAYPEIQCDYCKREFVGNDRKAKLARHRLKMHPAETHGQVAKGRHPNNARRSIRRVPLHKPLRCPVQSAML